MPVRQLTSPSGHVSRYTDPEMLEIFVAAAAGQVNKRLVATLQGLGCNAVGLSGVDGRLLMAERKDAVRSVEAGRQRIVHDDYTGKLVSADAGLLRLLLNAGYIPVVAPLALGLHAERLNVDGDRAAAFIAPRSAQLPCLFLATYLDYLPIFPMKTPSCARCRRHSWTGPNPWRKAA